MTDIARLAIEIDSTSAKEAEKSLVGLEQQSIETEKSIDGMRVAGVAMGVAIVTAATSTIAFTKSQIDSADSMNDLHLKTGLALSDLAAYDLLARQSGISVDAMAESFKFLGKYMTENGDKLRSLGVTATDQSEAMGQFADIISGISDPALRTSLAMEVLGRSGIQLLPALMGGSAAFEEARKSSEGYGNALEIAGPKADEFNDLMAIGETKIKQFGAELAGSLLPVLIEMAKGFNTAAVSSSTVSTSFNPLTEALRAVAILGGNVAFVFKGIGNEIGGMAAQIAALASGDISGFSSIGKMMEEDAKAAREAFDEWEQRIISAGTESANVANSAAEATKKLSEEEEKRVRIIVAGEKKIKESKTESSRAMDEVNRILADIDPLIKANQEWQHLLDLQKETGAFTSEQLGQAYSKAMGGAKEVTKVQKEETEKMNENWKTFADNSQRTMSDVFYNGLTGQFQNIEEAFKNMIMRMIANAAAASLTKALFGSGDGSSGTSTGWIGAIAGMLSFDGGGSTGTGTRTGGIDGKGGFPAIVHPNETVIDHTKGQVAGGGVTLVDNTVINIDSRSDRQQVMSDVSRMIEGRQAQLVDMLQRQGALA